MSNILEPFELDNQMISALSRYITFRYTTEQVATLILAPTWNAPKIA